jgi:uncharacterized membrane protein YcaP (DUF421 family)
LLFSNGVPKEKTKKKYNITDTEIMTALHEQNVDSYDHAKEIWLEPDGEISVVKKNS